MENNFIAIVYLCFIVLWVLAGLSAFIMSLVCFGYNNNPGNAIIGLLLAFFTGPFYWIYYIFNKTYCTK